MHAEHRRFYFYARRYVSVREPLTQHVKSKISGLPWSEKARIEHLLFLEDIATGKIRGWATLMTSSAIRQSHSDYIAILNELDPDWLERRKSRWNQERDAAKARYFIDKEREIKERHDAYEESVRVWQENGGVLDTGPSYRPVEHESLTRAEEEAYYEVRGIWAPWTPHWDPASFH